MNKQEKTPEEKKAILLKHYDFDEICEIMGFYDGSNEDVCTEEIDALHKQSEATGKKEDFEAFQEAILNKAIINGNFEEVIETDTRHAL